MDNQYGLKAVEKQNEITEQVLEPKRQFETQLDTPLTMGEYNAIADIYQNSDDKERDILKFGQALEYKRNYGLDLDYAYNNIDALNAARGIPQEYNWSTLQSIKNSFKISALNDKLSDLNSAWMDADYAGQDKAEIEKQIADVESQIEGLQDYAPRSLVTNMMKWAAESSVFTLTTIRDSLTWGAGAGLALAGLAGLAGVPITAGMTLTGLAWASLAGAVGTAATIGGTVSVANKTQGTMYRELRNQGVEKNLARSAASINGYVNGYIETALGVVPAGVGAVLKATGVEKLTATTMARLAMRGTWGTLGKMLANHVVDSIGEGEEEFFQSLADDITDAVVLTISDECKANGVKFDKSLRDVITDAIKAGGQGFGAALIMGVPTTAVNANVSVQEARRLKYEAKHNPSEADFVKHHENDSAFEGLEKKDVKDMLHQMYKAQNEVPVEERIDQTTIDSDIIEENVDIESEEDEEAVASEVPEKDIERMENGRLRTQEEKDYDVDLEGNEKHTLKVGTPNSSTRYGRVEYTVRKDGTIEIDNVSTKAGFQKSVTKDAVLELMRRYAGQDVVWNPTNAYQQKIKAELENENGGKLQRFASEYNQSEEAELGDFLHEKYGQFTPTQGKLLYGLYNNIAQHYGQTVHEMIADAKANNPRAALRFRYMSDAVKEGLIDKKQARRRGLIDYANRVIYVGENGDITTLFHEGFHMLSKVDKEGAQELVKAIAESKDMESYFKSHRAFFVPQLGLTVDEIMQELSNLSEDSDKWTENQDEILTSMFEAYLRDGKTFSKKLENIFSRIADFFIQIYRTLAGGNHLNDNIIKAFDKILEGNPELKEKYEQTEGVRAQNEPTPEEQAEADRQYNEIVAKYKGTSEWLKAPNGQPTKLTKRQWVQVRTPNFIAWFGDWMNDPENASEVVDENGEPLVVYHATRRGTPYFDVFKEKFLNQGFHFGTKEQAKNRAKGRLYAAFLNIRNMQREYDQGADWSFTIKYHPEDVDGYVYDNEAEGEGDSYVVFDPSQIKSATDNVGTFSESPNIRFQQDTEYLDAVNSGDMAKAQAMVDQRAREMGYNSPKLYHGTQDFGFTEVDVNKSDDTTSFFATDSLETAETYSGREDARQIGRRDAEEISRKVDEAWDKFKGAAQKFLDMLNKVDPKNFDITDPNDLITEKEWQDIGTLNDEELPNFVNGVLNKMSNMFNKAVSNNERLSEAYKQNTFGVTNTEESRIYDNAQEQIVIAIKDAREAIEGEQGSGNYALYAKTDKLLKIDAKGANWNKIRLPKSIQNRLKKYQVKNWEYYQEAGYEVKVNTRELSYFAKQLGYRGVEIKNVIDNGGRGNKYNSYLQLPSSTVYIFFNPQSQVKSADPVTYDDNGQVIPLSQRFNDSHSSLLFQSAYHGSGASFDKFDTDFMGTGEGAQAFGWGIYLTQVEGIARSYAEQYRHNVQYGDGYEFYSKGEKVNAEIHNMLRNWYWGDIDQTALVKSNEGNHTEARKVFSDTRERLRKADKQDKEGLKEFDEVTDKISQMKGISADEIKRLVDEAKHEKVQLALWRVKDYETRNRLNKETRRNLAITMLTSERKALARDIKLSEPRIAMLETVDADSFEAVKRELPDRNLYTATIPDDTGNNYLYWDKNLNDSQLNTIIENLKKDPTADKELLDLFEDDMKKGKKSWVKWRDGENVYGHIKEILGSPKAASEFLSSLGYVGIDYPANSMSGGNKYGKRNFVIFNADDIKVKNHLRFQNKLTEDERAQLVAEARDFDTFDDFLNYLSIMNGWVDPAQYSDALPVLDEIYGEAHGFTREKAKLDIDLTGLTDDEKDRTFEEYIDGDGIKNIMKMLHDMYTTYYGYVYAHGGLEDDEIEDAESLRARIREFEDNASMFIVNLAKSKKELSDKQFNSIRNVIKKNTRMYRELIADTLESETLRSDAEPDIKGTRTEERPTLADRSELEKDAGTSLDDKVEGEIEKKLEALDKELSDDEKAAEALTRELDSLMGELKGELTPEEQKALKNIQFLERFRGRKDEYAKALKKKIDNGEAISQAENTRLETVAKKIKELEESLAKFNDKQKAKNYIDKQNALKELKAEIREKQKQRRALKEMHEYKHKLVSYLQRKVPKSVAYEYKGMIEAIISMFSDVSGYDNNITYRGKSLTPKEFREAVDKDGALDELSKYQLKRYNGKSLADYTVEELERFADVKKRLVNIGRQMWQAKVDARNAEAAQIRQIILNHLRKNPKYTTAPLPDTEEDKKAKKSFKKKFSEIFTRTIPMSRITQMLDGGEKGFIYDLLTRDKRLVQDMERLAVRERINRVQELMDKLGVKKEDFYKPVEMSIRQSDDLGPASQIEKYTDTYTLGQLIYGILAQRNVRNANAFMFGDLVTQDEKAILNHNNDLIYDLGMKRNERFVKQAEEILKEYPNLMQVADAIVKDWQDINNKTRLNQVMIDEYNQGLDMEDFYMPIKRLDFNGTSLAQSIADDVYNQNAGKGMTTPKKGITYARKDILPDHQRRTNMDFLELWLNSVDEHEHLIATNAYVRKLNRVFKGRGSEDLRSAIENIYGQHITEDIDNYINDFANPPRATEDRNVSKWIRFMRGRLYEAYLGFKLSSFVLQVITSPAPFLREVNALQLSDYILKVMANPSKYWKFITERSTMMESRSIDPILAEIKKEKNDFTANQFVRTYHKVLAFGTGLLEVADRWMVSAGWLACYEKAMAERQEAINNGDMTQMQAELEASQYADEVVLETQPTGDRSELSPIFKTGSAAWQALTQFTTSLNVIWTNLLYDARTDLQNRNFKRAIMTAFAYALAGTVLYAVQDYEPPEDDENWIKDTILKLIYGMTSQGVSSVPLIGSGLEKLSKQLFTGEKQMMSQRVFPMFETARESLERIAQGKLDEKTVRKAIEAISLGLGLPVSGAKELEHIFRDRSGNWRYRGKRLTDNELLDFILKEKWQSVLGRRDNYGNKRNNNKK